jgi:lipopolysaccharide transport system ATP-binding protein
MPVIEVSGLTKEYRLGALQGLKDAVLNAGRQLLGRPVTQRPLFKALDDVSFSVEPGEVLGVIGHNGAGKSTLLKLLARVSTPTRGTLRVTGRIAPLIEVGAGFVPDFTGRENVYLNGAILGMRKAEIDRKFDEIVEFAEMAEFIDTPVKRYSSGMLVKLAFSVATSIESEILIVDEVSTEMYRPNGHAYSP